MGDWFQRHGARPARSLLAVPVALVAGLVSFFSPCVIPLLPGYLSYATGLSGADLANGVAGTRRGRMFLGSVLFVLGFAAVFVILGRPTGALGAWLVEWQRAAHVVLGVLMILLGLAFAGWLPFLQREWRIHQVPGGRAGGRAAARLPVRPRLDARASARRSARSSACSPSTRHGRPRRAARRRSTPSGSGCRSSSPALAYEKALSRVRVGAPPPGVGDAGRRPDAGRGRRPAGHRLVGPSRSPGCRSTWSAAIGGAAYEHRPVAPGRPRTTAVPAS